MRHHGNIEALAGKVLAHVKANAGHRLEQISAGLKIASKELKRPVATLLETKKLRTEGQKRGTKYFAGVGRNAAKKAGRKAAKRAGRKKAKSAKGKAVKKAVRNVMNKGKRQVTKKRPVKKAGKKPTTRKKATATVLATPIAT